MKTCPHCSLDGDGGIWCPNCKRAYDLDEARSTLSSIKLHSFTGGASLNPKVEQFWQTGDPEVFATPRTG